MSYDSNPGSARRIQPVSKPILDIEDIENKKEGNYLISFGFPGSGKTTFQWMMMNYLMNEGPFHADIGVPTGSNGEDWEGRKIINEWTTQWIEGRFPEATKSSENDIREINVKADTTAGKKLSVDFNFLEVSGELLRLTLPTAGHDPHLVPLLHAYLNNPRLKFTMMLMLHPDVEENDQFFASFMTFLDKQFPSLRDRMSFGIIVSKPEASLAKLREFGDSSGRTYFEKLDEDALEAYLNRFCGQTYKAWLKWPGKNNTMLCPLYLGETVEREGETYLQNPNFDHIEKIFFWLFEQFTGKRPGPTMFQTMMRKMDWT